MLYYRCCVHRSMVMSGKQSKDCMGKEKFFPKKFSWIDQSYMISDKHDSHHTPYDEEDVADSIGNSIADGRNGAPDGILHRTE